MEVHSDFIIWEKYTDFKYWGGPVPYTSTLKNLFTGMHVSALSGQVFQPVEYIHADWTAT